MYNGIILMPKGSLKTRSPCWH